MCDECIRKDEQISALQLDNVRLRNKILAMEAGILAQNQKRQRLPAVQVNQLFQQHPPTAEPDILWLANVWDNKL